MQITRVLALCLVFACQNSQGEGVQEIRDNETVGGAADIIRNPISADEELDTSKLAKIVFEAPVFDFGQVTEGSIVEHSFAFKNTGNVPLLISHARSSCGCTIPEWPKEPIPPGASGEIKAKFNTENKKDRQNKGVKITANTHPRDTEVFIKGFVVPK